MTTYEATTHGISVRVEPRFLDEHSEPGDDHFVWAYDVELTNNGDRPVQVMSRYWKITDANGGVEEVAGDGIVGKQPVLEPGEQFRYQSAAPLPTPSGIMMGYYLVHSADDQLLQIEIPAFSLDSPYERRRHH
ncbi:Co2+/Mg2+ efflux protein ApaG [Martelella mediterranea]|uniref:Protein ApaG n=1 Tax=Martelella mediterranea TaxID=293089 RepID=A0A4R3NYE3_9HYPH|nr:Co2+/Mg2+ efflux protein ApaG [Martelella mediterranea]TCT39867.1 ApaG protein [Martelella mediterranea]